LVLGSSPATAGAAAPADTSEAEALYSQGKKQYDIGEYEQALALWKEAYTKLGDAPELQSVRHTLVYNILSAEIRIYEVSDDVTHLRRAKSLLQTYLDKHEQLYEDTPEAIEEREATASKLAEVDEMLAAAEAKLEQDGVAPTAGTTAPKTEEREPDPTDPANAKLARIQEIRADPVLNKQDKKNQAFILGGSVTAGAGGILMVVGLVYRPGGTVVTTDASGEESTRDIGGPVGYVLMGAGAAAVVAGVTVLAIGAKRRKALRAPRVEASLAPQLAPGRYGAGATLRF
jgi:tetratricopeptide (TPR) repeat protein